MTEVDSLPSSVVSFSFFSLLAEPDKQTKQQTL